MAGLTPPRPLNADDDRDGFNCDRDSLDAWFRRHAWHNQESGATRTTVVCDSDSGAVAGFGFDDLPGDPSRSMAVRIRDLKASGF